MLNILSPPLSLSQGVRAKISVLTENEERRGRRCTRVTLSSDNSGMGAELDFGDQVLIKLELNLELFNCGTNYFIFVCHQEWLYWCCSNKTL